LDKNPERRFKSCFVDAATFDATQHKNPAPIFAIDQELRDQVKFWKDRRNDCAHSKQNQIIAAHCEAFYAFVRSTLNRFISMLKMIHGTCATP
jgi:hypothetical protein